MFFPRIHSWSFLLLCLSLAAPVSTTVANSWAANPSATESVTSIDATFARVKVTAP